VVTCIGGLGFGGTDLLVGAPRACLRLPRRLRLRPEAFCGETRNRSKEVQKVQS
jgi:hypothetical protein